MGTRIHDKPKSGVASSKDTYVEEVLHDLLGTYMDVNGGDGWWKRCCMVGILHPTGHAQIRGRPPDMPKAGAGGPPNPPPPGLGMSGGRPRPRALFMTVSST